MSIKGKKALCEYFVFFVPLWWDPVRLAVNRQNEIYHKEHKAHEGRTKTIFILMGDFVPCRFLCHLVVIIVVIK